MAGELERVKASLANGAPASPSDLLNVIGVAESALDYTDLHEVAEENGTPPYGMKMSLQLSFLNLRSRARSVR